MEKQRQELKNKHIHQSKINSINKMKKVMEIDSVIYKQYDQLDIKKKYYKIRLKIHTIINGIIKEPLNLQKNKYQLIQI